MYKDSIYTKMYTSSEQRLNMGYDYESNGLLDKFVSPAMYNNPRLAEFLKRIDPLFLEILKVVKKIQFYHNYTIDKNDSRINQ
jgi:hypothetical protein